MKNYKNPSKSVSYVLLWGTYCIWYSCHVSTWHISHNYYSFVLIPDDTFYSWVILFSCPGVCPPKSRVLFTPKHLKVVQKSRKYVYPILGLYAEVHSKWPCVLIFIAMEFISVNFAFLQEVVEEIVPNNHVPPCPPGNTVFDRMCIDYSSRTGDASSVSPGRLTYLIYFC